MSQDFLSCNDELIKIITKAVKERRLVIFVGAGISQLKPYQCSNWQKLAVDLINICYEKKCLKNYKLKEELQADGDSKKKITIAFNLLERAELKHLFESTVEESFNHGGLEEINYKDDKHPYAKIKRISNVVITTNADGHIDKYWTADNISYDNFNELSLSPGNEQVFNDKLYKIHGSYKDTKSMVFTVSRYLQAYTPLLNEEQCLSKFLRSVFSSEFVILFLGYGLAEFEILDYLFKGLTNSTDRFFLINGYYSHQQDIKETDDEYYQHLGIKQLVYLKDENGYEGIHDILDKIINEVMKEVALDDEFTGLINILENPYDKYKIIESVKKMKDNSKLRDMFFSKFSEYSNLDLWFSELYSTQLLIPNFDNLKTIYYLHILKEKYSDKISQDYQDKIEHLLDEWITFFKINVPDANSFFAFSNLINLFLLFDTTKIDYMHGICQIIEKIFINGSVNGTVLIHIINERLISRLVNTNDKANLLKIIRLFLEKNNYKVVQEGEYTLGNIFKRYADIYDVTNGECLKDIVKTIVNYIDNSDISVLSSFIALEKDYFIPSEGYLGVLLSAIRWFIRPSNKKIIQEITDELFINDLNKLNKQEQLIRLRMALFINSYIGNPVFLSFFTKKCKIYADDIFFVKYELYHYIEKHHNVFSYEQIDEYVIWLKQLTYSPMVSLSDIEKNYYLAGVCKEILLPLKDLDNQELKKFYKEVDKVYPHPFDHPGFHYWIESVKSTESSHCEEDFDGLSVEHIIKEFNNIYNLEGDKFGSVENNRVFAGIVRKDPNKFLQKLEYLDGLAEVYYPVFLRAMQESIVSGFNSSYFPKLLNYIEKWLPVSGNKNEFLNEYIFLLLEMVNKSSVDFALVNQQIDILEKYIIDIIKTKAESDNKFDCNSSQFDWNSTPLNTSDGKYFLLICNTLDKLNHIPELLKIIDKFKSSKSAFCLFARYINYLFQKYNAEFISFFDKLSSEQQIFLISAYFVATNTFSRDFYDYIKNKQILPDIDKQDDKFVLNKVCEYHVSMYLNRAITLDEFTKFCCNTEYKIKISLRKIYFYKESIIEQGLSQLIIDLWSDLLTNHGIGVEITKVLRDLMFVLDGYPNHQKSLLLETAKYTDISFLDWFRVLEDWKKIPCVLQANVINVLINNSGNMSYLSHPQKECIKFCLENLKQTNESSNISLANEIRNGLNERGCYHIK